MINNQKILRYLAALLTVGACLVQPSLNAVGGELSKPNIVLIYADDLDADEINYTANDVNTWATPSGAKLLGKGNSVKAGIPKVYTPNIDSLAEQGVVLSRFYVNATVCTSSRYCLLTGHLASRGIDLQNKFPAGTHATMGWNPAMLRDESNLQKELQKLGYRTGIIGKWHNLPLDVLPKRKKTDHSPNPTLEEALEAEARVKNYYQTGFNYLSKGFGWDVVDRMEWGNSIVNLDWQCEGALKFIEESSRSAHSTRSVSSGQASSREVNQPFFLYCALPVPHGQYSFDYNDVTKLDRRVTSNGVLDKEPNVLPSNEDILRRLNENGVPVKNSMATYMDDYVGAILSKLDEHGLRENTIVIFSSDHGSRGKNSCYEGAAKVPMFVCWPAGLKHGTVDSLIGNIDIAQTLIEIAGGETPADMTQDSMSFLPQLLGRPEPANWRKNRKSVV